MAKLHWTQTPRGRKIMSENARNRAQKKVMVPNGSEDETNHISYLFGKVETIIELYGQSSRVPFSALASGVAGLLQRASRR